MSRPSPWGIVATTSALAALLATVVGLGQPIQPLVVFWFLLVCPGLSLVRLLQLESLALEVAAGIAVSLAIGAVISQALLYSGRWSPLLCLLLAGMITVAAVGIEMADPRGRAAGRTSK